MGKGKNKHHHHTDGAPWHVAVTDDKTRGRLNIISHLLDTVPYEPLEHAEITLPRRGRAGGSVESDRPTTYIPIPY